MWVKVVNKHSNTYINLHQFLLYPHSLNRAIYFVNTRQFCYYNMGWRDLLDARILLGDNMKETLGLDSVDNISLDNKVLNEIKDSNLLDRFVEIFPNLYQAITNTALAKGGIYQAILPAGAKLARSLKMEGAFRGMYHGDKGIKGQANFVSKNGVAITNAVMSVASIIVGQYYMNQINNQLREINKQLDEISSFQETEYQGKIYALMAEIQKSSKFQTEIIENEDVRKRELDNLKCLEHECAQLLGQANASLMEFEQKSCQKFSDYEVLVKNAMQWFQYQQVLLSIIKKIEETTYTCYLGRVSAEYCYSMYHQFEAQAGEALKSLHKWHEEHLDRFDVDVVLKNRKRKGWEKWSRILPIVSDVMSIKDTVIAVKDAITGVASVGVNEGDVETVRQKTCLAHPLVNQASIPVFPFNLRTKLSEEVFLMICQQMMDPTDGDNICETDLFQNDVSIIIKDGKVFFMFCCE